MAPPAAHLPLVRRPIDGAQHRRFIELDEGGVAELGARLAEGARRDRFKGLALGRQPFQEVQQAALQAAQAFLEDEQHHARKG